MSAKRKVYVLNISHRRPASLRRSCQLISEVVIVDEKQQIIQNKTTITSGEEPENGQGVSSLQSSSSAGGTCI